MGTTTNSVGWVFKYTDLCLLGQIKYCSTACRLQHIFSVKDQERRHDAEDRDGAEQRPPAPVERIESAWSTWTNLTMRERIVDSNLLILGPDDMSQMSQMLAQVELWKSCL